MDFREKWAKSIQTRWARYAAMVLLLAILSVLSVRCNPKVGRENVLGLVLEIEAVGLPPQDDGGPQARVLVAAVDTVQVTILLPPPVPRPGDFIPLIAEYYRKGNVDYFLDLEKWQIEGPK